MALFLVLALGGAQTAAATSIEGHWRSPGGNSIIAIAKCDAGLCGTIAWASDKAKKDASATTDSLIGTQILTGVRQGRDGRWQGKLFIPDRNMRVTAKLQLVSATELKVSGCLIGKSLCRSNLWTRTDEALPRAD
jgi:uncharacterized protein (DUF2147 family)